MENFYKQTELEFEDKGIMTLIADLQSCYDSQQNNFCKLCFCVNKICNYFDCNYIGKEKKSNEYYDKNKLLARFGFERSVVSRMINCYLRFMTGTDINSVNMKEWYIGYSQSKLFEMLNLSTLSLEDAINKKLIRTDMTVKDIRAYIKSVKDGNDKAEKVLEDTKQMAEDEEIPMAYDPSQHYDLDYFDTQSKKQLVNMIWELQKYCEKLKAKINTKSATKKKVA